MADWAHLIWSWSWPAIVSVIGVTFFAVVGDAKYVSVIRSARKIIGGPFDFNNQSHRETIGFLLIEEAAKERRNSCRKSIKKTGSCK